jgi:hypothetical protein
VLRFRPYGELADVPNVVVDGSPTPATTLTLSHWPGTPSPGADLEDDLSAQMALRYVAGSARLHGAAEAVTNNHFDQDGLVSIFALADPEAALARRPALEDLAAAGDFATYARRDSARASMAISAFTDGDRSPFGPLPADYGDLTAHLYSEALPRLAELIDDVDRYRALWADEDAQLTESQAAVATGAVAVEEHADVDLAVVTVHGSDRWAGHRFGGRRYEGVHPMAIHGATACNALLLVGDGLCRFTYRYETWVQYRSRPMRPRADLQPLADALTAADDVAWTADAVNELTPEVQPVDPAASSLAPDAVVAAVVDHLRTAPPAFDPYRS